MMDMLFPPGSPSRIPIAALTGTNGKTTTARMLAHIEKMNGHPVGLATTDGVYVDGERTVAGDMTGPQSAQMIQRDPSSRTSLCWRLRAADFFALVWAIKESCDVGAVLNVQSDHLGSRGVETVGAACRG